MNSLQRAIRGTHRLVFPASRPLVVAAMLLGGCAEVPLANQQEADKLANVRADLEQETVLAKYQAKKKDQAHREGKDADALYDDAEQLKSDPRFVEQWKVARQKTFDVKREEYLKRPAKAVNACVDRTSAAELDKCIELETRKPAESLDPKLLALLVLAIAVAAFSGLKLFRSVRQSVDPVAQAAKQLGLALDQGTQRTTAEGNYKGTTLRLEASAPEAGEGDRFLRVTVQSGVSASAVVRFGPLAPPSGLELPDLDAPEVADPRTPEGYKLRLSEGVAAEALLAGDFAFQVREYDPIDIRIHDGVCAVTVWRIPSSAPQVIEFVDVAVAVARLYPAA
jgi:hypothetical protein